MASAFTVFKSEIRNPKSEIRNPKSEIRNPKSEIKPYFFLIVILLMSTPRLTPRPLPACASDTGPFVRTDASPDFSTPACASA